MKVYNDVDDMIIFGMNGFNKVGVVDIDISAWHDDSSGEYDGCMKLMLLISLSGEYDGCIRLMVLILMLLIGVIIYMMMF